jgi:hypothetical protein
LSSAAIGLVALLTLVGWVACPLASIAPDASLHVGLEDAARTISRTAHTRATLEVAVVLLQVSGVAALCISRLLAATRWADRGRVAFVAALVGLGLTGILCAWYGSDFALFAGATMAILLNVVILGSGQSHAARSSADTRPASRVELPMAA